MARFSRVSGYWVRVAATSLVAALNFMAQTPAPLSPPSAALPSPVEINGAAKLLSFTGQISVLRSDYAWALNVGGIVNRQEVIVTGPDGWGVFQVADGSKFEVFPNSRIVFRANQGDWKDLLEVFLGKVRVQIEHFGGLPNNNKVHTPSAVISVRGTIFTVEVDEQSESTFVLDEEGSVAVRHALVRMDEERVLIAGESLRVYRNTPLGKAVFDKGGFMQRAVHAASDAFYQAALNARNGTGTIGKPGVPTTSSTSADKNNGGNAPAPPPAPPPPPPH
jgi:ferric-dicitrate binding protein FerR (iron transport regulator)